MNIKHNVYDATEAADGEFTPVFFEVETNGGVNMYAQTGVRIGVSQGWKRIGFMRG